MKELVKLVELYLSHVVVAVERRDRDRDRGTEEGDR